EEERDVQRVANLVARHAGAEHFANTMSIELLGMERERLEKAEHRAELLVDWSRAVIIEDGLHGPRTERRLRDRGVGVSSKDALVELRYESRESLAFANGPRRWPT